MAKVNFLQLALLAGGGFLVYSYLMQEEDGTGETFLDKLLNGGGDGNGGGAGNGVPPSGGNGNGAPSDVNGGNGNGAPSDANGGNGTTSRRPPTRSRSAESLLDQIRAMELGDMGTTSMDWDQHNWFYLQVTGNAGPSPESVGIQRQVPMPNMSIESWGSELGLSGIYLGPAPSNGLGFTAARPSRWERATKEFGV